MRSSHHALLLGAFSLSLLQPGHPSKELVLCSLRIVPAAHSRAETVLLATASPDSILAGEGTVKRSAYEGHFGPGGPGPIYGQVFDVRRFAGGDSARLSRAFRANGNLRAVIVPWDYDPACIATRWTRGATWVPRDSVGTFTLTLRPDSLWTNGLPVFDAFEAAFEPYPLRGARSSSNNPAIEIRRSEALNAEQYFELTSAVPPYEAQQEQPDSALRAFTRWQELNPALAKLWPTNDAAEQLARSVSYIKARRALRSIEPLIAGTYQMTFRLDGDTGKSFFARTRGHALDEWRVYSPGGRSFPDPLTDPPTPEAYNVLVSAGRSIALLSKDCSIDRAMSSEGYMYVIDPGDRARRREWRGWIELSLLERQFPEDSALRQFNRQSFNEWSARYRTATELEAPARFWLDDAGVLRVEQTIQLQDGRSVVLRGNRVSSDVVTCSW